MSILSVNRAKQGFIEIRVVRINQIRSFNFVIYYIKTTSSNNELGLIYYDKKILYFLTPSENISPFDVTIAADAGFDMAVPFTKLELKQVSAMVQDAIFCRPPNRFNDTGIFIGGRDVHMATDMFQNAKNSMVGPFKVGVFADPNGAYTTSASIVALIEKVLNDKNRQGLIWAKSCNIWYWACWSLHCHISC